MPQSQHDTLETELQVSAENKQPYQIMGIQKSLVYSREVTSANLDALEEPV